MKQYRIVAVAMLLACSSPRSPDIQSKTEAPRLPTGALLDPAGRISEIGALPLAMVASPDGKRLVLSLNGYRENGVQIVDRQTGAIVQTLVQPAAFIGLVFSPDGKRLYASGGNDDVVYSYDWIDGTARASDTLVLAVRTKADGRRYPAGVGVSLDGSTIYVAENLADSLAVVDVATGRVTQRFATERYPYGVAVGPDGTVYVSAWGGSTVSVFKPSSKRLVETRRIIVGRHPSALLLNKDGTRLFAASASTDRIAVVDTRKLEVIAQLSDAVVGAPSQGSTPNALALSPDGRRLFVAEADNNSVALLDLSAKTSGVGTATGNDEVTGRIPSDWYPSALVATRDSLFVANAKGRRTGANPDGPGRTWGTKHNPLSITLAQISGTLMMTAIPRDVGEISQSSARVARANGWDLTRANASYPPIEHVIYIIKENRTYDQVFGDLMQADGDTSLLFFPRRVSPNQHALAERFGIFDRFFVNAEVSPDGHNWSTAAYTTDYVQKTVPANYSNRGRTYDYEGTNRDEVPDDDVASPVAYLWNLAQEAGITFRNYGEFVIPLEAKPDASRPGTYRGLKPYLAEHTNERYPDYDLDIPDQRRADIWITELATFERSGNMPAFEIVRLPNDHTAGARAGSPTPHAYMADNDLALGRMIEALSKTQFWRNTAVFVVEDDAQNGSDHVDSHRSPMLVISPWARGGVVHRFTNTTDVVATMEELLKLRTMSHFDRFGRPLRDIWASRPDVRPYVALIPSVSLEERNPAKGALAEASRKLALQKEDIADEELFNRILWRTIKGEARPWPGVTR
ncbi:MAG: bifunctional YncE family protein/alkaline phosphatase family protein [Gemmatimonadales bacterium]